MRTKIDELGRVEVPAALRRSLGLENGSEVDVERQGKGLAVLPVLEVGPVRTLPPSVAVDGDRAAGEYASGRVVEEYGFPVWRPDDMTPVECDSVAELRRMREEREAHVVGAGWHENGNPK